MIQANKWWANLEAYNLSIFPIQIVMFALALLVCLALWMRPSKITSRLVKAYLALAFGWISVVFFLILGKALPMRASQTFLFISLAALFAFESISEAYEFRLPEQRWLRISTLVGLGLTFLYPVVGVLVGHAYPRLIIPGTFPCPTTALALVLMSTTQPKKHRLIYYLTLGLLLLWAIPFPIFIQIPQFGVYEDGIMLTMGLYSLIALAVKGLTAKRTSAPSSSPVSAG